MLHKHITLMIEQWDHFQKDPERDGHARRATGEQCDCAWFVIACVLRWANSLMMTQMRAEKRGGLCLEDMGAALIRMGVMFLDQYRFQIGFVVFHMDLSFHESTHKDSIGPKLY